MINTQISKEDNEQLKKEIIKHLLLENVDEIKSQMSSNYPALFEME